MHKMGPYDRGADLFRDFFWSEVALGLSRLLFGENPGVKCRFRAVFKDIWGGFRAVQAPF